MRNDCYEEEKYKVTVSNHTIPNEVPTMEEIEEIQKRWEKHSVNLPVNTPNWGGITNVPYNGDGAFKPATVRKLISDEQEYIFEEDSTTVTGKELRLMIRLMRDKLKDESPEEFI